MVQVVPVKMTQAGRRYIEFECARYVYNGRQNLFAPFEWSVGSTNQDVHAHSKGLTSDEAAQRQELVGKNEIAFQVDSFWGDICKE